MTSEGPQPSSQQPNISRTRILVGIASYGTKNDGLLAQLIAQYRAMAFAVDIVVFSNLNKPLPPGVELRVGLPARNPWSLPFAHQAIFASRLEDYDLFIYSEDDILITEENILAFQDVTKVTSEDEITGFIRTERDPDGRITYPDIHGHFHWDASSATVRGDYVLAFLTCEHAACYVLTRKQLRAAIASGGYLVKPHEWEYDLLCTAATDPYTQCGLRKLVPISHIDSFCVEHLSNRYVGKLGIGAEELRGQLDALSQLAIDRAAVRLTFRTETKLRRRRYSKPLNDVTPLPGMLSAVGKGPGSLLSVGCGNGALESELVSAGWSVVAIPADPVVAVSAAARGIDVMSHDPEIACRALKGRMFDRIIGHYVFHLMPDPARLIALLSTVLAPDGRMIISLPNMWCYRDLPWNVEFLARNGAPWSYAQAGARFTSVGKGYRWCNRAGLRVERVVREFPPRMAAAGPLFRQLMSAFAASEFIVVAKK